jgi:Uri superfamily endonuclease
MIALELDGVGSDDPGTYALILKLSHPTTVCVGRLGCFQFAAGWYAYVGSARGPGGLIARVTRHLCSPKPLHWHIDYLREYTQPVEIWYATGAQRQECAWAKVVLGLGGFILAPRFGASDCRCPAHLIAFPALPDFLAFAQAVGGSVSREILDVCPN